jgi:cholesterol oxidase
MTDHFDAIIVGSGFGGSVLAYRLAEAGWSVCVLERGQAHPPGSFPRTPDKLSRNFWSPRHGLHGMFDLWSFRRLGAVVASGLGGGSLIYSNVHLRKDPEWFVDEHEDGSYEEWLVTRADLDPHYDRVERMLDVQPYPLEEPPYRGTAKTHALRLAAEQLKQSGSYREDELRWLLPPLAVSFRSPGAPFQPGAPLREVEPNLHGVPRSTCRLCGECNLGCNYGSKNTLDLNYLSAARRLKAQILTRREVKRIRPRGSGYEVSFVDHEARERVEANAAPTATLTCSRLILAAGAIGSPYLLLKNRSHLPGLNQNLGQRFAGNGDILGAALRCDRPIEPSAGPVITAALRVADALDGGGALGRGFYLQDAGFPAFLQWMMVQADAPAGAGRVVHFVKNWVEAQLGWGRHSNVSKDFADLVGDGALPARLLPLLGMGRERPSGTMTLTPEGDLDVDWSLDDSKEYFARVRDVMKDVAAALGGSFTDDPVWFLMRSITVHPLGGCPMGTPERGFVDSFGQVHGQPGLYVADGSVMPGSVGPNPSLTIAALADRFADRMLNA